VVCKIEAGFMAAKDEPIKKVRNKTVVPDLEIMVLSFFIYFLN
jgi:hypothetical protein